MRWAEKGFLKKPRWIRHIYPHLIIIACVLGTAVQTRAALDPKTFSGQSALDEVRAFLATGPRVSGTPGAAQGAAYLQKRLTSLGLSSRVDEFSDPAPSGPKTFRNVLATLPGQSNGLIVLVSHYDTKPGISDTFVGANDSGSSSGLLLAMGAWLKTQPPLATTVLLAFTDGEECARDYTAHDGLNGSRRLARQIKEQAPAKPVLAVIVLDMIGDRDLTVTIPRNGTPALFKTVFDAARAESVRRAFYLHESNILDDHVPFLEAGLPAIDLIDFKYGSAPGLNDYWHTPADTFDKLSAQSLETVGRVTLRMINMLQP
jgi:glutaminyl-peptide cyclotransferase